MADNNQFNLRIIAPDRIFYQGAVDMVEFNTTEGEIGVLPGHIPMTVIISPGILAIHEADTVKEAALHAGFAEILPDRITILAEVIEWPGEINKERARNAADRAQRRLEQQTPDIDVLRAEVALKRALTRISVVE